MHSPDFDVIVIGAGLHGIAFARTYLEVHPRCRLLILEKDSKIGGVWSKERVFDDFWTQSSLHMSYFSDVVLNLPTEAPLSNNNFQAKYVAEYLDRYLDNHIYNGKTLRDRVRLNAGVETVSKSGLVWALRINQSSEQLLSQRLIVATGLTSCPMVPSILQEQADFIPVVHHKDFGRRSHDLLRDDSAYRHFTVIGAGKSAADLVYAVLKAGKPVNWLIRQSGGRGPGIFLAPQAPSGYRHPSEAMTTVAASELNPSAFHAPSSAAQEHHSTEEGRSTLRARQATLDDRCKSYAGYTSRANSNASFASLEPYQSFWWHTCAMAMVQHDDFWDLVSTHAQVYIGDIERVEAKMVKLTDGRTIPTDAVLCGSGWKTDVSFLGKELAQGLGFPRDLRTDSSNDEPYWLYLMSTASRSILKQYPILADGQDFSTCDQNITPIRLYRNIAPLADDSILFLGMTKLSNSFRPAEAQAIWATAFFDGNLDLPSEKDRMRSIAYHNAFSRLRYPNAGVEGNNNNTEVIWYTDTLATDVGLSSHRKEWFTNTDAPCLAADFGDCVNEYIIKYQK